VNRLIFWNLINASRREVRGEPVEQMEALKNALVELEIDDIFVFDRIFSEYHNRAYTFELWGAAYVIGGGCSDDGFTDFRGWLISRGEEVYEAAMLDPESLVKVIKNHDDDGQIEGFQYVASIAWEEKTGKNADRFPGPKVARSSEPTGVAWEESELPERYPKLSKKFG